MINPPFRLHRIFILALVLLPLAIQGCSGGSDDGGSDATPSTNACSQLGLSTRIINGTACNESGSPIVRLTIFSSDGTIGLCSGTLLSPTAVLTAGHCFFGTTIRATAEVNGVEVRGNEITVHPQLAIDPKTNAVLNDIAVLHLSKSLPGPTLPLLGSRDIQNGELVSIFGYGLDENQKIDVLKSGEMKVSGVTDNHIFAKFDGAGSNTCNGDSGGPAIYTFTKDGREIDAVVGVVSTGEIVDCSAGDTTLFANAHSSSNLSFITQSVPSTRVE